MKHNFYMHIGLVFSIAQVIFSAVTYCSGNYVFENKKPEPITVHSPEYKECVDDQFSDQRYDHMISLVKKAENARLACNLLLMISNPSQQ